MIIMNLSNFNEILKTMAMPIINRMCWSLSDTTKTQTIAKNTKLETSFRTLFAR